MRQIWTTLLASFCLLGFAAMVSAAAIAVATERPDARSEGRAMMIEAQYRLAQAIKR